MEHMLPTLLLSFSNVLLLIFLVMFFVTVLFSSFLIYHWRAYGESTAITMGTTLVYLIGALSLVGGMATAVLMTF